MLSGSLFDKILIFALPFAFTGILQQIFNSADIAVIGRWRGNASLAAVSSNAPIINIIVNLFVGLSTGANVVVANFIGQDRRDRIETAVHTSITLALISGVFLAAAGPLLSRTILRAINTPVNVLPLATRYLSIYFLAMPAMMIYNFGSAILRAKGDSRRPLYALLLAGILNVALNLLFVVCFGMDVEGVAIPTVISNCVSAALIIVFLLREEEPLRLRPRRLGLDKATVFRIAQIGIPAGLQGMVFSVSNLCIQGAINSFGADAMAGSGSAQNFEYFSYFLVSAFTQAATTFTSQNFGAHNTDRCRRIFRLSMLLGLSSAGALCGIFVLFRHSLIRIYTTDDAAIYYAMIRIVIVESFEFLTGSYEIPAGALRAMGHSLLPTILILFGSCILRIVWLLTVYRLNPTFEMVMVCYPISWMITGPAVITAYAIIRKKMFRTIENAKAAAN